MWNLGQKWHPSPTKLDTAQKAMAAAEAAAAADKVLRAGMADTAETSDAVIAAASAVARARAAASAPPPSAWAPLKYRGSDYMHRRPSRRGSGEPSASVVARQTREAPEMHNARNQASDPDDDLWRIISFDS